MKSSKQRRIELLAKRKEKRDAAEQSKKDRKRAERTDVNVAALAPDNSYGVPDYVLRGYYVDKPFTCKFCGKEQIWTARQQKWWYEVAKGGRWTTAILCRPCRRREQARRAEARRVHQEGLARKQHPDKT